MCVCVYIYTYIGEEATEAEDGDEVTKQKQRKAGGTRKLPLYA